MTPRYPVPPLPPLTASHLSRHGKGRVRLAALRLVASGRCAWILVTPPHWTSCNLWRLPGSLRCIATDETGTIYA